MVFRFECWKTWILVSILKLDVTFYCVGVWGRQGDCVILKYSSQPGEVANWTCSRWHLLSSWSVWPNRERTTRAEPACCGVWFEVVGVWAGPTGESSLDSGRIPKTAKRLRWMCWPLPPPPPQSIWTHSKHIPTKLMLQHIVSPSSELLKKALKQLTYTLIETDSV